MRHSYCSVTQPHIYMMHGPHGVSSHNTCVQSHDTTCYVGDLLGTGHSSSHFTDEIQATSVARVSYMHLHGSCLTHRIKTISTMHVYTSMGESTYAVINYVSDTLSSGSNGSGMPRNASAAARARMRLYWPYLRLSMKCRGPVT